LPNYVGGMNDSRNVTAERIKERLAAVSADQNDLAEGVGLTQSAISQILSGKTRNSRYLPAIADWLAVNLSWIRGTSDTMIDMFDDKGERINEDQLQSLAVKKMLESPKSSFRAQPSTDEAAQYLGLAMIPHLELGYSMGGGNVISDYPRVGVMPFFRDWLRPMMKGSFADLFVARGEGDSMVPTLMDGDLILIDMAQKTITQQDRLWALSYGDLGMIKRVRKLPDGGYQINSDNPAVTPMTAYDGEMHVVGRVIWIGRRV
jgi:transcriptional regulator with XRE-family HTH domain